MVLAGAAAADVLNMSFVVACSVAELRKNPPASDDATTAGVPKKHAASETTGLFINPLGAVLAGAPPSIRAAIGTPLSIPLGAGAEENIPCAITEAAGFVEKKEVVEGEAMGGAASGGAAAVLKSDEASQGVLPSSAGCGVLAAAMPAPPPPKTAAVPEKNEDGAPTLSGATPRALVGGATASG